jgi:hypothetical protein
MPPHEAMIYGITSALNAATLHTFDPHITSAMGSVLSSSWFERVLDTGLNPLGWGPAKPQTLGFRPHGGASSSSSGSAYGSGYSYAWLRELKGLGSLQDVHLDMPTALPGQVRLRFESL